MLNAQRTQEKQRGQTRVLLRGNNPIPNGADGKSLPGLCPCAHSKDSMEASMQAFLACMLFPAHLPLLTLEVGHSATSPTGHRKDGQHKKPQSSVGSTTLHTSETQDPGLEAHRTAGMLWWSCCHQRPPTSATRCSSTTSNQRSRPRRQSQEPQQEDAEIGEPRALHLPHSHGTAARETLFDLQFLMPKIQSWFLLLTCRS